MASLQPSAISYQSLTAESCGLKAYIGTMPDTLARIEETLDTLRPYIASHRGQVEVVDFDESDGVLLLLLGGTCSGCSASSITLRQGIEARLRQMVPEVKQVDAI